LECYNKALEINNHSVEAYVDKALLLNSMDQSESALQLVNSALEIVPESSKLYNAKSIILSALEKEEEAITAAQKAVNLDVKNTEALANLGDLYYESGEYKESAKAFREIMAVKPNSVHAKEKLGWSMLKQEKFDDSITTFEEILKNDAKSHGALYGKGLSLYKSGKPKDAIPILTKATQLKSSSPAWNYLGRAHMDLNEPEQALKVLKKFVDNDADYRDAYHNIAAVCVKLNKMDDAIRYLDQALEQSPQDPIALQLKGEVLFQMKKTQEANELFTKAKQMDKEQEELSNNKKHQWVRDLLNKHV